MIIDTSAQFLDRFFVELAKTGIDLSKLEFDHLAYQSATPADYESLKLELARIGRLGKEPTLNGRRIASFILTEKITYKSYEIKIIELLEPEPGSQHKSDWQHIEFTITDEIETLLNIYPELDWDQAALHRDHFPLLKLKLANMWVKFPRIGLREQLGLV
jgi:predicted metalloenzyme YecM